GRSQASLREAARSARQAALERRLRGHAYQQACAENLILVDSSVWIDFFRDADTWQVRALREAMLKDRVLALTDRILQEVLQGFDSDTEWQAAANALGQIPCFDTGGSDLALHAARNFRYLRRAGATVRKPADVLIATFCVREKFELLHDDR